MTNSLVQESEKYFDCYYTTIARGQTEGSIQHYPVEIIGSILYQDIVGVMNLLHAEPDSVKQEKFIQCDFTIFWDGICTNVATAPNL